MLDNKKDQLKSEFIFIQLKHNEIQHFIAHSLNNLDFSRTKG